MSGRVAHFSLPPMPVAPRRTSRTVQRIVALFVAALFVAALFVAALFVVFAGFFVMHSSATTSRARCALDRHARAAPATARETSMVRGGHSRRDGGADSRASGGAGSRNPVTRRFGRRERGAP